MTGPKRIAVGFDGSPDAEVAVQWSAAVAAALGARLRIVHAVGLLEHAGAARVVAVHEERARQLATAAGLDVALVEWLAADGDPCSVLERQVGGETGADLLVVGTRGAGAHSGGPLGSTSLELVERAVVPVVVVPNVLSVDGARCRVP